MEQISEQPDEKPENAEKITDLESAKREIQKLLTERDGIGSFEGDNLPKILDIQKSIGISDEEMTKIAEDALGKMALSPREEYSVFGFDLARHAPLIKDKFNTRSGIPRGLPRDPWRKVWKPSVFNLE
jgi:hypothetical protein